MSVNKGLLAGRYLRALVAGGPDTSGKAAYAFAEGQNWSNTPEVTQVLKATVDAMGVANSSSLAGAIGIDLMALVRPRTLIGRLENLRRMPFGIQPLTQTAGVRAIWVHESYPKPVQASSFVRGSVLMPMKVAAITIITNELARFSEAENILLQDLSDAAVQAMDESFIDPSSGPVASERPAAVTYGAPSASSAGQDYAGLRADIRKLVQLFPGNLSTAVLITDPRTAVDIALMAAPFGGASFDLAQGTGNVFGLSAILTASSPNDSSAANLALVDPASVEISGGDTAQLSITKEAAIQMSNSPTSGATQMVSLWQANCTGLLAEIPVNWQVRSGGAASVIMDVSYSGE